MKTVASRQSPVASGNRANDLGGRSISYYPLPATHYPLSDEHGVILIALIWILTALSVIALSFSRESFVEVSAARNAQSLESSYFIARAGIAETIYRLIQKRFKPVVNRPELQDITDPLDLGSVTGQVGGGYYRVDIQDESGKININGVSEEQLRLLVEASGINKPDSDIITDSILDWRDADNLHRINGAEDEYYQSLNPPYKAKNGRIDTAEELLLMRGVTPEYFYGLPVRNRDGSVVYRYGLSRYLTPYSLRNQVNVNFAPVPVLLSVPGISPQVAQMLFERRRTKPFKNLQEILRELPVNLGPNAMPLLTTDSTGTYTLTASAYVPNSKVRRVIRAVIALDASEKTQYRTLYWNENVPDYEGIRP